jgi:hypothetical protein
MKNHLVSYEISEKGNYDESINNIVFVEQSSMNQISNFFREKNRDCLITDEDCKEVIKLYGKFSSHPNPGLVVRSVYRSICERIYNPISKKERGSNYIYKVNPVYLTLIISFTQSLFITYIHNGT